MDARIYLSQGFCGGDDAGNTVIALIGCFVGDRGLLPGLGPIQRRGNLTAAGLCVCICLRSRR